MFRSEQSKFFVVVFLFVTLKRISSETRCDRYLNDNMRIDGKVVIVTGGTSGLGLETARNLAGRGGRIYITSRDEKRGNDTVEDIRRSTGNQNIHFIRLDLASLKSVQRFSKTFHAKENRLDILINNAGIGAGSYQQTEDGFELDIGVNHLGPFFLTNLLLDLLKASAPSRIIVVTSIGYLFGDISQANLNSEKFYPSYWYAYTNSKLANVLFARELSKRLEKNTVSGKHFKDCAEEKLLTWAATSDSTAQWLWEASRKLTKLDQYLKKSSTIRK